MSRYKVEKGVPLAPRKVPSMKYPFFDMEVGNSFVVDGQKGTNRVRAAAVNFARRHGVKFQSRTMEDGNVRVWRIA